MDVGFPVRDGLGLPRLLGPCPYRPHPGHLEEVHFGHRFTEHHIPNWEPVQNNSSNFTLEPTTSYNSFPAEERGKVTSMETFFLRMLRIIITEMLRNGDDTTCCDVVLLVEKRSAEVTPAD